MPDDDRKERRDARVTINKEFESFDAFIQEYVTNISRSGVFIKSKNPRRGEPPGNGNRVPGDRRLLEGAH